MFLGRVAPDILGLGVVRRAEVGGGHANYTLLARLWSFNAHDLEACSAGGTVVEEGGA